MTKTVYTLIVDSYAPSVTALTLPHMRRYAEKIGARFHVITDRKFPDFPPVYEKLQIHELGRGNDWNIFFDADVLVHPDLFDVTEHLPKDTVMHWRNDLAGNRWTYDRFFRRDGRHIGSGNWFTVASDWCLDLWKPLDDLTLAEAARNIHPTIRERNFGIQPGHLIDDYTLSRNIAKFGLKFRHFEDLLKDVGHAGETYFFHNYLLTEEEKVKGIEEHIAAWCLDGSAKKPDASVVLSETAQAALEEMQCSMRV